MKYTRHIIYTEPDLIVYLERGKYYLQIVGREPFIISTEYAIRLLIG